MKRPLVAIIATGDELLPPGSELGPDQIISSNAYGVAAAAQSVGARALDLGIAADRKEAIAALVKKAVAARADVIVTLGGASVGDHDLVHDVLTGEGMTLDFWKIAMRPGKPLMFGRLGDIRCIGLPGNPVASLVCSQLFLKPLLAQLGGRIHRQDIRQAQLGAAMPANDLQAGLCARRGQGRSRRTGGDAVRHPGFLDAENAGRRQWADRARALRSGGSRGRCLQRSDATLKIKRPSH